MLGPNIRRQSTAAVIHKVWILGLLVVGCGPPPPPPGAMAPTGPTEAPEIAMILPAGASDDYDLGILRNAAMVAAGRERVVFTTEGPMADEPPERQAELVREAGRRGAAAVIVVPPINAESPPPGLADAAAAVRDDGASVVILGFDLKIDGPRAVVVSPPELDRTADALVAALQNAAKVMSRSDRGPALVLARDGGDRTLTRRASALAEAFRKAGVEEVREVVVPEKYAIARAFIREGLATAKGGFPTMVAAAEDAGLDAGLQVRADRRQRDESPDFALGGFSENAAKLDKVRSGMVSALAMVNPAQVAAEAVKTAVKLIEGESMPDRREVAEPIRVSTQPPDPSAEPRLESDPPEEPDTP
jgi:ABC-type sugar transport system substrate-binding protein